VTFFTDMIRPRPGAGEISFFRGFFDSHNLYHFLVRVIRKASGMAILSCFFLLIILKYKPSIIVQEQEVCRLQLGSVQSYAV
jgi:hypothetical protein